MDTARDQYISDNPTTRHDAGGRNADTGAQRREAYLKPINQNGSSTKGSSYTDMTFTNSDGRTVYIQTVDKGYVHGMSQREWDNANRIAQQDLDAVIILVAKGDNVDEMDLNADNMQPGINNKCNSN